MNIYTHWVEKPCGELYREYFATKTDRDVAARAHIAYGKKILAQNEHHVEPNAKAVVEFLNKSFQHTTHQDLAEEYVNEVVLGGGLKDG